MLPEGGAAGFSQLVAPLGQKGLTMSISKYFDCTDLPVLDAAQFGWSDIYDVMAEAYKDILTAYKVSNSFPHTAFDLTIDLGDGWCILISGSLGDPRYGANSQCSVHICGPDGNSWGWVNEDSYCSVSSAFDGFYIAKHIKAAVLQKYGRKDWGDDDAVIDARDFADLTPST